MINFDYDRIELLKHLPSGAGAEVGVAVGNYTTQILNINNTKRLYLIDAWKHFDLGYKDKNMVKQKDQDTRYEMIVEKFGSMSEVKIIRELSVPAAKELKDNELDWVYIDADHSYQGCLADLYAYEPKVKAGGFICGHDWMPGKKSKNGFGVNKAVLEFCEKTGHTLVGVTNEDKFKSYMIKKN